MFKESTLAPDNKPLKVSWPICLCCVKVERAPIVNNPLTPKLIILTMTLLDFVKSLILFVALFEFQIVKPPHL